MQIEAIELASNFILKTTLHNPRVLSRAETPIAVASHGAAWKSDEAVGFVRIVPPMDGIKGLDLVVVRHGESEGIPATISQAQVMPDRNAAI